MFEWDASQYDHIRKLSFACKFFFIFKLAIIMQIKKNSNLVN